MKKIIFLTTSVLLSSTALCQDYSAPINQSSDFLNDSVVMNSDTSSSGYSSGDEPSDGMKVIKGVNFDLKIHSITTSNYKDKGCGGILESLWMKDCNPEFRIEFIICNSKKECISRLGGTGSFMKAGTTKVIRTKASETYQCKDINLQIKDIEVLADMAERIVDKVNDPYYVGFQLVEFNSILSSTIIGKKIWPIEIFKQFELQQAKIDFVIQNSDKTVKMKATVLAGNKLE